MKVLLNQLHPFGSGYVVLNDDGTVIMGRWSLDEDLRAFKTVYDALDYIHEEQKSNPDHMNIAKAQVLRDSLDLSLH